MDPFAFEWVGCQLLLAGQEASIHAAWAADKWDTAGGLSGFTACHQCGLLEVGHMYAMQELEGSDEGISAFPTPAEM